METNFLLNKKTIKLSKQQVLLAFDLNGIQIQTHPTESLSWKKKRKLIGKYLLEMLNFL